MANKGLYTPGSRNAAYTAQGTFDGFPARSPIMASLLEEAKIYAEYDVPILISGEPRLAKSRLAECIHNASPRRDKPFVSVDLSTVPPEYQYDLLFSRSWGGEAGMVTRANGGTLFMLDVHCMSPDCQRQLLSILRSGSYRRKGSAELVPTSVRLICSTFEDLMAMAQRGEWMWQLANTLYGINLRMPPIRETPEDVPTYLEEYLHRFSREMKKQVSLTEEAIQHLCRYPWPNNLRDIEYFCMKAIMLSPEPVVDLAFVREKLLPDLDQGESEQLMHVVASQEELALRRALKEAGGSRNQAAEMLGISRSTLWRRLKKYHLQ